MKKKNSLGFETAKDILTQITSGLLEYHNNNLVHGDVGSSQIAIFNNNENIIAKLTKFPINGKS
jgi:serine/threonine protein kinase